MSQKTRRRKRRKGGKNDEMVWRTNPLFKGKTRKQFIEEQKKMTKKLRKRGMGERIKGARHKAGEQALEKYYGEKGKTTSAAERAAGVAAREVAGASRTARAFRSSAYDARKKRWKAGEAKESKKEAEKDAKVTAGAIQGAAKTASKMQGNIGEIAKKARATSRRNLSPRRRKQRGAPRGPAPKIPQGKKRFRAVGTRVAKKIVRQPTAKMAEIAKKAASIAVKPIQAAANAAAIKCPDHCEPDMAAVTAGGRRRRRKRRRRRRSRRRR